MAEDVRHTPLYRDIYKLRQQKIERVFADAKEKHGMRYTQYRGLAQVTNWVNLKFAAMNLKKLATWKWKRKNPSPGKRRRRILAADYFSWLLFFYRLSGTQLGAACFCTSKGRKSPIFVSVKQGQ